MFELIKDLVDYFKQHKYRFLWPIVLSIFASLILLSFIVVINEIVAVFSG